MATPDASNVAASFEPQPARRRPYVNAVVRLLAMLIAAVCAVFSSNNWCCILLPAALAAFLVDCLVCAVRPRLLLRMVAAVAVGAGIGWLLGIRPDWAFREAFGVDPPPGVRDVRIWRHYLGGPGEHVLIIEFVADDAAFRSLLASRTASSDGERVQRWRDAGGEWTQVFDVFVGPGLTAFAHSSWQRIRPLANPTVYELGEVNMGGLRLFCEPDTGRCVALHQRY